MILKFVITQTNIHKAFMLDDNRVYLSSMPIEDYTNGDYNQDYWQLCSDENEIDGAISFYEDDNRLYPM